MKRTPMHGPTLQEHNDASLWSTRIVPAGRISTLPASSIGALLIFAIVGDRKGSFAIGIYIA